MGKWSWDASDKFDRLEIQQKNVTREIRWRDNKFYYLQKEITDSVIYLQEQIQFLYFARIDAEP